MPFLAMYHLGRAFGRFGLMQQLGLSVGPLVGGVLYDNFEHRPLVMWGVLSAGMAVLGIGYFMFARVYLIDESGSGIVRAE